jgi:hypothetical protein
MSAEYYISLNNYKVRRTQNEIKINPMIKEMFIDPITLEYFKKPIYIPESKMIYDYNSIKEWLLLSDKDPLTGIKIDKENIKSIPVLNYFMAMLSLEEQDDDLYFHPPNGNLLDILHVVKLIFDDQVCKKINNMVSLNLLDYMDEYTLDNDIINFDTKIKSGPITYTFSGKCLFSPITFEDIFIKCPISRRIYNKTCLITDEGIFTYPMEKSEHFCISRGNTLSDFNDFIDYEIKKEYNMEKWLEILNITDVKEHKIKIINKSSWETKYKYTDIDKLDAINTLEIEYPNMKYILCQLFEKNKNDDIVTRDWYLQVKSTEENIYQFFLKHKNTVNNKTVKLLSELLNKQDISQYGPDFVRKREFYNFPSILKSTDMVYGNDYSFLEIKDKIIKDKEFKMYYFVGTKFDNVQFVNCRFMHCVFIGATHKALIMIKCQFSGCSFYKIESLPHMLSCDGI